MKHIVIVTTSYPHIKDGSEAAGSFVEDFAMSLSGRAFVTVVAPGASLSSNQFNSTLRIVRYKTDQRPLSLLNPKNPFNWISIVRTLHSGMKALDKVVTQREVDHILALWVLPSGYWAKCVGAKCGVPYSTWALGSDIWSLRAIPLVRQVLKIVLRNSQNNFADGYLLKKTVKTLSGTACHFLPSTRKLVIPKLKMLSGKSPYKLAFLGRWHHNKGVDILIESLYKLSSEDWMKIKEVRICGGGPLEAFVRSHEAKLQAMGLPVTVGGYLNKEEAVDFLSWADYVLIPSRVESIPVVVSDAIKCRCPVVSMPVGDLPALIGKHNIGILSEGVSSNEYALAISKILNSAPLDYGQSMEDMAFGFDINNVVDSFLERIK